MKKNKKKIIFICLLVLLFFIREGFFDIPQTDTGVVIEKKYVNDTGQFGVFTIQLDNKMFPRTITYDRMEYTAFEIGDRLSMKYKIPLLWFLKPYGTSHEIIN